MHRKVIYAIAMISLALALVEEAKGQEYEVPGLTTISQFAELMDEPAWGTDFGGWVREDSLARMVYVPKTSPSRDYRYIITKDGMSDTLAVAGGAKLQFARGAMTYITPLDPGLGKEGGTLQLVEGFDCQVNRQTWGYHALYRMIMYAPDDPESEDWYYLDSPDTTGMLADSDQTYVVRFSAHDPALDVWRRWSNELIIEPMGWTPPDTTDPDTTTAPAEGPSLSEAYWANDYTLRVIFDGGIDPTTFEASDIEVTGPNGPLAMNPPSWHWDTYFNLTCYGCGVAGDWKVQLREASVADTLGVYNTASDSLTWAEPGP